MDTCYHCGGEGTVIRNWQWGALLIAVLTLARFASTLLIAGGALVMRWVRGRHGRGIH